MLCFWDFFVENSVKNEAGIIKFIGTGGKGENLVVPPRFYTACEQASFHGPIQPVFIFAVAGKLHLPCIVIAVRDKTGIKLDQIIRLRVTKRP